MKMMMTLLGDIISLIITCKIEFYIISQKLQVKCCSAMYSLHSD
jgi:hypothetical protein